MQRLISHISTLQGYIDMYASWYTCNYTSLCFPKKAHFIRLRVNMSPVFTAILHCLALFLIRQQYPLDSEPTPTQIRQEIEACLRTMRNISRGSIVNQKADYCIQRLLVVFDALGKPTLPPQHLPTDYRLLTYLQSTSLKSIHVIR